MEKANLSLHCKMFNDKVRAMLQTGRKELVLTKEEASNLQADIFNLLSTIAYMSSKLEIKVSDDVIKIDADGGKF